MIKQAPLKKVLNFIPKYILDEEGSESQLLLWALDLKRTLDSPYHFLERDVKLLVVKDHKAELPKDVMEINLVTFLFKEPSTQMYGEFLSLFSRPFEEVVETGKVPLSYRLWVHSNIYNHCFIPLKFKGRGKTILCKTCPNLNCDCEYGFTIKEGCIWTDFKEGLLCLDYDKETTDDDGNILVPDNRILFMAMAEYIKYKHWENRVGGHEENAERLSEKALIKAQQLATRFKGEVILRGIDDNAVVELTNPLAKVILTPTVFSYREREY